MLTRLTPLRGTALERRGVTLLEAVVTLMIFGVIATILVLGVETSSRLGGENRRIEDAVRVLAALRDASVRYNLGTFGRDTSFTARISYVTGGFGGVNPGRLSQLTNKITTSDRNSCNLPFGTVAVSNWVRNFYSAPMSSSTSFRIADGFIADDLLQRFDTLGNAKVITKPPVSPDVLADTLLQPGTLAIVMKNVAISDAKALAEKMEGEQDPTSRFAAVRFVENGSNPVTVYYHMAIRGC